MSELAVRFLIRSPVPRTSWLANVCLAGLFFLPAAALDRRCVGPYFPGFSDDNLMALCWRSAQRAWRHVMVLVLVALAALRPIQIVH